MKDRIFDAILLVISLVIIIGLLLFWLYAHDIHMEPQAWLLILIIGLGILNYMGFRG